MLKIGIFRTHQCPDHIEGPFMRGDTNEEAQKILISTLKKGKNRQRRGISTFPKNFSNFPSWNRGGKTFFKQIQYGKRGVEGETLHIFFRPPSPLGVACKNWASGEEDGSKTLSAPPYFIFSLFLSKFLPFPYTEAGVKIPFLFLGDTSNKNKGRRRNLLSPEVTQFFPY